MAADAVRGLWRRLGSLSLVTRIILVSVALIIGIGLLVNIATVTTLRRSALENQAAIVANTAATRLEPFMRPDDLRGPLSPHRRAMIDAQIRQAALDDPDQVGIVLWRQDGSIAYSTDPGVMGQRAIRDDELRAALAGRTQSQLKPASKAEIHVDRPGLHEVMEVYVPLPLDGQHVDGALEIYHDPARTNREVAVAERAIGMVQAAALAVMLVVLALLVRGASRQLRQQSERLVVIESRREVERLQTEFVGVVSHELRTPLTALVGFSELLLDQGASDAERREWTELLNHGAERLRHLVEGLLDVTRIDEGRMSVRLAPIDLADAVAETLATFAPAAERVQLVDATSPGTLPPAMADRDRVIQVLTNLMSNAVKYSPGGGRVEVTAGQVDGMVRLTIADQGLGIPADELPRVFSRFHRIEDEQRREIDGSGLGLYISKRLVELQGGSMSVESPGIGLGSRFHVDLPIAGGLAGAGSARLVTAEAHDVP